MIRTIEAGVLYFALVFAAGFVLGTIHTLWVVPRVGTRNAELMETLIIARGHHCRSTVDHSAPRRALYYFGPTWDGFIALLLLLVAKFGFVLWLRGQTIREYFASRDPVAGTVYGLMLAVFAVMPLLVR